MTAVITIDGPTSSGKNSVGFLLAKKLRYRAIDTGMIYRAGAFLALKNNISQDDLEKVLECYKNMDISFEMGVASEKVYLEGEDVTGKLHSAEISRLTSYLAAKKEVREVLITLQRKLGLEKKTVMSGRDIGSVIFPEACFKFYLTAKPEIRARRRFNQMRENPGITYEAVLEDLLKRDEWDTNRDISPLKVPEDAVVVDSSDLTVEEVTEKMLQFINNKL